MPDLPSRQVNLAEGPVADLLGVLRDLDVNRLSDAIDRAREVSRANPSVIFHEVDAVETHLQGAIREMIEARGHLQRAIGNLIVTDERSDVAS